MSSIKNTPARGVGKRSTSPNVLWKQALKDSLKNQLKFRTSHQITTHLLLRGSLILNSEIANGVLDSFYP